MAGLKISLEGEDLRKGWERITLGTGPRFEEARPGDVQDLCFLWNNFIEHEGGVYTIMALYTMWFARGLGTEEQWTEWSRDFIEAGVEGWLRAYWAGVPMKDIVGR